MSARRDLPERIRRGIAVLETTLLLILLAVMVGVATYQIAARNLFGGGIVWGSELVHVAMLWVTMIGAVAAAGTNRHIKIDLVARFASRPLRRLAQRITAAFASALCVALGWFSLKFISGDFIEGTPGFGPVPAWVCEIIIPVAAVAMAFNYLLRAIWPLPDPAEPDGPDTPANDLDEDES